MYDLIDCARSNPDRTRHGILRNAHGPEILLKQNLTGGYGFVHVDHLRHTEIAAFRIAMYCRTCTTESVNLLSVVRHIPHFLLQPRQLRLQLNDHVRIVWIRVHAVQLAGVLLQIEEFPFRL